MFTVKYNRTTNHIDGIESATMGGGNEVGGVVGYYAQSACSALTRGRFATGKQTEDLAEALKSARIAGGRKVCKKCEKAAEAALNG